MRRVGLSNTNHPVGPFRPVKEEARLSVGLEERVTSQIRRSKRRFFGRLGLLFGAGVAGTSATLMIKDRELDEKVRMAIGILYTVGSASFLHSSISKQQRGKEVEEITRALNEEARRNKKLSEMAEQYAYVAINKNGKMWGTNHPKLAMALRDALVISSGKILS